MEAVGTPRPRRLAVAIAFAAFVSLGLPDGVLGVAWPSIRRTFALPISHLGALLLAIMAGYLASSFSSGALVGRWGVGRLLSWSNVMVAVSCAGYALAPGWPVMLAAGLLAGLGAGAIDAGINAHAAAHFPPRLVSWLHASWGMGAALGPLLMTGVLARGLDWRWGYALIGLALAGMASTFFCTPYLWGGQAPHAPRAPPVAMGRTLRHPAVWMQAAVFFLYTGLEASAGQWAYTLLTEARGFSPATAGAWVGGYWASLTLGRLACGVVAPRVAAETLLRVCLVSAPVAAGLIWAHQARDLVFVGLGLLGFSLAPVYPLLISATPARLGHGHAVHAIGFQVAAACLGAAVLPGAAGLVARWHGLESIATFLVLSALLLLALHEILLAQRRRGAAASTG